MLHDLMAPGLALPWLALAAAAGYLAGSLPFGLLIARALGLGDIRAIGSGNIGATNVLRTGHKGAAAATLILDAAKGAAPTALFLGWGDLAGQAAAAGAMLGHCYPVWLGFKGGKGVATFFGVLLALHWPAGLASLATWLAGAGLSRRSSVGALAAAAATPLWFMAFQRWEAVIAVGLLALLTIARHGANIRRLIAGTEPRIGQGGAGAQGTSGRPRDSGGA